jgi:predicted ester cyclase
MLQAGVYPLRPALGHAGLVMPPASLDGLCREGADLVHTAGSVQLVMDMLDCLRRFDGVRLASMDLENYWHSDFMWYGPAGIGTTRGIAGFRRHHQGPFVSAFPDRDVDHHACTVASGDYVATGGWPHMHGTHLGGDWLGLPASGRRLELRVMDIWRREGGLLKENWVAIDIPQMLLQMGLDVFSQMQELRQAGSPHG